MFERAVTIDVIFADIQQDADRGIERRRKVDLVRRHLDHMDAAGARRLQRQDGGADIAAHLGVVAGHAHQMCDQRGGGRFAVGAGDRDEGCIRRVTPPLAAEQFDVADHLHAGLARREHSPVRRRMGQRHPRRQHQGGEVRPRHRAQVRGDEARFGGFRKPVDTVIAGDHLRAARLQRMAARKPRASEAEHRDRLAREGSDGNHGWTTQFSSWPGLSRPSTSFTITA